MEIDDIVVGVLVDGCRTASPGLGMWWSPKSGDLISLGID